MDTLLAIHSRDLRLAIDLLLREEPGINVVGVASETEALMALLQTARPDLILLDWDLPGRPILETLPKIQRAATRHPKVIVLGDREQDRESALTAGADEFIIKGEPPQHLVAAIRQAGIASENDKIATGD
jgi:DNA-binding NarL/FixJ family response regulator